MEAYRTPNNATPRWGGGGRREGRPGRGGGGWGGGGAPHFALVGSRSL